MVLEYLFLYLIQFVLIYHSNSTVNETVGQNVATIYGEAPGLTISSLVDIWYMELLNMNSSLVSRYRP